MLKQSISHSIWIWWHFFLHAGKSASFNHLIIEAMKHENRRYVFVLLSFLIPALNPIAFAQTETTKPEPISTIAPQYPEEARKKLEEGEVVLEIVVKSDGTVGEITTISSDNKVFTKAAVQAVSKWKFKPAENNGEAVSSRMRVPIPFKISSLVFDTKELTRPPKPISRPAPRFPQELRKQGIQGKVLLVFIVRKDGTTANIEVSSSDHPGFNAPAIDAVRRWKFEPGEKNGKLVNVRVRVPVPFRIR